jgi:hypothetical protein
MQSPHAGMRLRPAVAHTQKTKDSLLHPAFETEPMMQLVHVSLLQIVCGHDASGCSLFFFVWLQSVPLTMATCASSRAGTVVCPSGAAATGCPASSSSALHHTGWRGSARPAHACQHCRLASTLANVDWDMPAGAPGCNTAELQLSVMLLCSLYLHALLRIHQYREAGHCSCALCTCTCATCMCPCLLLLTDTGPK